MHHETLVVTPPVGPRQAAMTAFPAAAARDLSGEILAIAQRCYVTIPADFRRFADEIGITIQDFPDDETVVEMGCTTRWDLLGLYSGISVGDKEAGTIAPGPDSHFPFCTADRCLRRADRGAPCRRRPPCADPMRSATISACPMTTWTGSRRQPTAKPRGLTGFRKQDETLDRFAERANEFAGSL